jgi:hypothetical protein
MLVHGRPFTEVLVSGPPDDISRTQPVFSSRAVTTGPGSIAEVPLSRVSSARPCRRQIRIFAPNALMYKHTTWAALHQAAVGSVRR